MHESTFIRECVHFANTKQRLPTEAQFSATMLFDSMDWCVRTSSGYLMPTGDICKFTLNSSLSNHEVILK